MKSRDKSRNKCSDLTKSLPMIFQKTVLASDMSKSFPKGFKRQSDRRGRDRPDYFCEAQFLSQKYSLL